MILRIIAPHERFVNSRFTQNRGRSLDQVSSATYE
nr:MAG TPA: hypothetical protein [Caudoviricetes sp.]